MKKIKFTEQVLPHLLAVVVFLLVTLILFGPVVFENKTLRQHDITQFLGSSKVLRDYREATGQEGLWAPNMFSGMPAYLVNVQWSDGPVVMLKKVMTLFLPHPVNNIFLAFASYYILLLVFRVRPYLAIAGALAFGLSSYMIIGLAAGHNARIGAIALMPLVVAGIHLAFIGKRWLGAAITAAGLALHLRENHLQITYYLMLIVAGYGLLQLVIAFRQKQLGDFAKTLGFLAPAAVLAACTFFGQFWAIAEYSQFSIRGASELSKPGQKAESGLTREYAFDHSNGIAEPLTLVIPNVYGGASGDFLVNDQNSATYRALASSGNNELANQLANYTSAYWGPQSLTAPYYAGAAIVLCFLLGLAFADRSYAAWLGGLALLGVVLSWGSHFSSFNYFLFDFLPGYNKFRSVTFALVITLFSLPLLGLLGVEKILSTDLAPGVQKKLWYVLGGALAIVFLLALTGGWGSYLRSEEYELPDWFRRALAADREALFTSDAWRSFWLMLIPAGLLALAVKKIVKPVYFGVALVVMTAGDHLSLDNRYFTKQNFQPKREARFSLTAADQIILQDKGYYRVYNLNGTMAEANTSYYHNSIGGYHGAKMKRYQDIYDSAVVAETQRMIRDLQSGDPRFDRYGVINMLNVKYITFGTEAGNVIPNSAANGAAWFVRELVPVNSANEELSETGRIDTRVQAVVDQSRFTTSLKGTADSLATVQLVDHRPNYMKYESEATTAGVVVFSEVYYPRGWAAFIDGKTVPVLRANYVLRALEVPAGKHVIEFRFEPKAYVIGNRITQASSWVLVLVLAAVLGVSSRRE
ncbi:MAG: YfhO family protein [Cyclobacteriaceae bacterium]|jgi:hypothetical protein